MRCAPSSTAWEIGVLSASATKKTHEPSAEAAHAACRRRRLTVARPADRDCRNVWRRGSPLMARHYRRRTGGGRVCRATAAVSWSSEAEHFASLLIRKDVELQA